MLVAQVPADDWPPRLLDLWAQALVAVDDLPLEVKLEASPEAILDLFLDELLGEPAQRGHDEALAALRRFAEMLRRRADAGLPLPQLWLRDLDE